MLTNGGAVVVCCLLLPEPPRDCRRHSSLSGRVHARPSRCSPEVRERAVWMVFECERFVGPRKQTLFGRLFYTPYWTTFELPAIDTKVASVGILDQIATGLT
jgi:hypothetical protein